MSRTPAEYDFFRQEVKALFAKLPRGSQAKASYSLEISPTTISIVLSGRYIDEKVLAQLKTWASSKLDELAVPA